ncbi:MAG: site-2 protease family protein, partial [Candidatus Woesearchaeota archaeon]
MSLNAWLIAGFYFAIIVLIYFNRKKFDVQAKLIYLYRTSWGISFMDKFARNWPGAIKWISIFGIIVGFLGMIVVFYLLVEGTITLFIEPEAPASIAPVIPGVKIPGSSVFVPFWYGIISIFIVAVMHEAAHGIVARLHKLKVKATGIVFFGPIIGAFVEPDENQVKKLPVWKQLSLFAAGPFVNIATAFLVLGIILFIMGPVIAYAVEPSGVKITNVQENMPAKLAGLKEGDIVEKVNDVEILTSENFTAVMKEIEPGDFIKIKTKENEFNVKTTENPNNSSKAYLGIVLSQEIEFNKNIRNSFGNNLPWVIIYFAQFLGWLALLSFGIGIANLLPLGPIDGGRMLLASLSYYLEETKA